MGKNNSNNAVIYALVCGLVIFMVLPHALAALDRWRFLRRLRRALASGALVPVFPDDVATACGRIEVERISEAWIDLVQSGVEEVEMPLLGAFMTENARPASMPVPTPHAKPTTNRVRNIQMLFSRCPPPPVLPTTTTTPTSLIPPSPASPLQGTFQFATLVAMPSPHTSKLYNTAITTPSCSLSMPAISPPEANTNTNIPAADTDDQAVSETHHTDDPPQMPGGVVRTDDTTFLATLQIGTCHTPLGLDPALLPPPPPPLSPSATRASMSPRVSRDGPFLPAYRMGIGYAGGAGVMVVPVPAPAPPPRRNGGGGGGGGGGGTRDDDREEDEWDARGWTFRVF